MYYTPPQFRRIPVTCVFTGRVDNSVGPDQLASQKPADLDLHCFQKGGLNCENKLTTMF